MVRPVELSTKDAESIADAQASRGEGPALSQGAKSVVAREMRRLASQHPELSPDQLYKAAVGFKKKDGTFVPGSVELNIEDPWIGGPSLILK